MEKLTPFRRSSIAEAVEDVDKSNALCMNPEDKCEWEETSF